MNIADNKNDKMCLVIGELANTNYYNDAQNLVRVKVGNDLSEKYYDFSLITKDEVPNPTQHYALIWMLEKFLENNADAILPGDTKLKYIPGYINPNKLATQFAYGFVMLINKKTKNSTTNMNVSQLGTFNNTADLASDSESVRYSLSPTLNKPYTTTVGDNQGDINNENIGVFITDNSVHIKSEGGSIVLGPDGIAILGERSITQTTGGRGVMGKNPLGTMIPGTAVTVAPSIEYTPNIEYIAGIGNTLKTVSAASSAMGQVTSIVANV